MYRFLVRAARAQHVCVAGCFLAFTASLSMPDARADYPGPVVRIDEDWEFVATADGNLVSITCSTSPVTDYAGEYMTFELNHQSQPGYSAGGLHLNVWNGESYQGSLHAHSGITQSHPGETVQWTQSVALVNGQLLYEVSHGTSTSWGAFGSGELTAVVPTSLENLNGYNVNESLWGLVLFTDGVQSLTLRSVHLTTSSGAVYHVSLNRNVLESQPEGQGVELDFSIE